MTQYWIWPVTEENWEVVKAKQIWATHNEKIRHKVLKDDMIIFYVTRSGCFQGVYKVVSDWYVTKDKVWSDEIAEVKYPYQVRLEVHKLGKVEYKKLAPQLDFVVSKRGYRFYIIGSDGGPANHGKPINETDYQRILVNMGVKEEHRPLSETTLTVSQEELAPQVEKAKALKHNELRDIIAEIGRLEGKSVEVEYPIDNLRLDVVWKSIPTGNPKWVFEVQLAGNFYEALTKLKHAWDKWNSKPFLVTTEEFVERARWLLEGSFHEMKDDARLVNWNDIVALWEHIKAVATIKKKIKL